MAGEGDVWVHLCYGLVRLRVGGEGRWMGDAPGSLVEEESRWYSDFDGVGCSSPCVSSLPSQIRCAVCSRDGMVKVPTREEVL